MNTLEASAPPAHGTAQRAILVLACLSTATVVSSITAVIMGLSEIATGLRADFTDLQWIVNSFSLALATLLLTAGALGDKFGHKKVFATGLAVFGSGSLVAGLAGSAELLIGARAVVGVGGAAVLAGSLALIGQHFPGAARNHALAIWGAAFGGGTAAGLLFGGVLVELLSWHWLFASCVPLALVLLLAALRWLPADEGPRVHRVDWAGFVLFTLGTFSLVFALIRGNLDGWDSMLILAALAVAGGSLIAFVVVERSVAAPMLDLRLFRDRNFTGSAIASFCIFAAVIGSIVYLALYQLTIQKYSPLEVGLQATTFGVTAALGSVAARRLTGRLPDRALVATGLVLVAAGLMLFHGLEIDSGWRALLPGYLLVGLGFGLVQPSLVSAALSAAPPEQSGMVSGASNTFRQLGAPAGIAALGAVFQIKISDVAGRLLAATPLPPQDSARLVELIGSGETQAAVQSAPEQVRPVVGQAAAQAFVDALNLTLLWAAAVAVLGAVLALAVMATRAQPADRPGRSADGRVVLTAAAAPRLGERRTSAGGRPTQSSSGAGRSPRSTFFTASSSVLYTDVDGDGCADVATEITGDGRVTLSEHVGDGQWTVVERGRLVSDGSYQRVGGRADPMGSGSRRLASPRGVHDILSPASTGHRSGG